MANKERDAFLARAMGECWHEFDANLRYNGIIWPCKHCGDEYLSNERVGANRVHNFSSWNGFGKLITWLKDQPLWNEIQKHMAMKEFMDLVTDPNKTADKLYEYLRNKQ